MKAISNIANVLKKLAVLIKQFISSTTGNIKCPVYERAQRL